jgi:hypothetical protein
VRVIIAGSRSITDAALLEEAVSESGFEVSVILCGEARGVDQLGRQWAEGRGIATESYPPEWARYGRAAGQKRNADRAARADALVLLWDGSSRGSANMLRQARKRGLRVYERVVKP